MRSSTLKSLLAPLLPLIVNATWAQLDIEHRFLYPERTTALALIDVEGDGDGDVLQAEGGHLYVRSQIATNEFVVTGDLGATGRADRLLTVDLDADGIFDLVLPRRDADAISWMQGLGNGAFLPLEDLITGIDAPFDLKAQDMDGDFDLDLVMAYDTLSITIAWSANTGSASFSAPVEILNTATGPFAPERISCFNIGDVDGDGTPDVLIQGTSIVLYTNDGAGLFTLSGSGTSAGSDFVLMDADADGDLDLVFDQGPEILCRQNDGSGTFGPGTLLLSGTSSTSRMRGLHAADVDGDLDTDLVYIMGGLVSDADMLLYGVNNGTMPFTVTGFGSPYLIRADNPFPFALGNANANALSDVVALANDGLYLGSDVVQARHLITSVATPASISTADLDGDGGMDVILSGLRSWSPLAEGFEPLQVAWHENEGLGEVRESPHEVLRSRAPVRRTLPADLDGDDDLDLVVVSRDEDAFTGVTFSWYSNHNGVFSFEAEILEVVSPSLDNFITMPEIRDLDMDGDLDLAYYNIGGPDLRFNDGSGGFQTSGGITDLGGGMYIPAGAALCDIDGDGDPDHVWSHGDFPPTLEQDSLFVNLNPGNGLPGPPQFIGTCPVTAYYGQQSSAVRRGVDIDGLGAEDLVTFVGDSIAVQLNTGVAFNAGELLVAQGMISYDVGDMNGDGLTDILALAVDGDLLFWAQLSDHSFTGPYTLTTGAAHSGRTDLRLADMDGDGDLDVVTCAQGGAAAWLENEGGLPLGVAGITSDGMARCLMFPNPATEESTILFPRSLEAGSSLEIVDAMGRTVDTRPAIGNSAVLRTNRLVHGTYIVRVLELGRTVGSARLSVH